jgi:hypothetical protein
MSITSPLSSVEPRRSGSATDLSPARLHLMRAGYLPSSCSLVVLILAVTPWRYTWRTYVHGTGDPWR